MKNKPINNKGSIEDIFTLIVLLFGIGLVVFIVGTLFYKISDVGLFNQSVTAGKVGENSRLYTIPTFDYGFFGLVMIGFLAIAMLAYQVRNNPILFWIGILVLMVAVIVSVPFSNMFEEMTSSTVWDSRANTTLTTTFWDHAPQWVAVLGILVVLAIYAFSRFIL